MVSFTPLPGKFELCFAVGNDNWSHDFYGRPVPERKTIIDQMVADRRAVCHEVVIPDTKKG
jgi:hypothetical protein